MGRRQVAERFAAIASCVQEHQPDEAVVRLLTQAEVLCEEAACEEASGELKTLLMDVRTALQTWQAVWPRLGRQPEFRRAVAREAQQWSTRFSVSPSVAGS